MDPRGEKYRHLYADKDVYDWFNHGDALLTIIEKLKPVECLEMGTWMGASAIPISRMVKSWGGILYCVDSYQGNSNMSDTQLERARGGHAECQANFSRHNIDNALIMISDSSAASKDWEDSSLDLIYVDAAHEEDKVLLDLQAWWPKLKLGGVIAGDDYGDSVFPGVTAAWDSFGFRLNINYQNGQGRDGLVWIVK